jgi:hypothetical protein
MSLAVGVAGRSALAGARFGPYDVRALFAIDKSNDRNRNPRSRTI